MQRCEPGQKDVELAGIIRREHAREPVVRGIVDGEACLQASETIAGAAEYIDRPAELIGFRYVFGVIDDRVGAAREWQRHVERLRFGARTGRRRDNNFERRSETKRGKGVPGLTVVGFEDEFNVKFFGWVIERANSIDEFVDHPRLAVERTDDRVYRQAAIFDTRRQRRHTVCEARTP